MAIVIDNERWSPDTTQLSLSSVTVNVEIRVIEPPRLCGVALDTQTAIFIEKNYMA